MTAGVGCASAWRVPPKNTLKKPFYLHLLFMDGKTGSYMEKYVPELGINGEGRPPTDEELRELGIGPEENRSRGERASKRPVDSNER